MCAKSMHQRMYSFGTCSHTWHSLLSEIILCTDSVPYAGVGSLSGCCDTTGFYSTVSVKWLGHQPGNRRVPGWIAG